MATMDDGPMMNEGQSWTSWADTLDLKSSDRDDEEEKEKITRKKHDNDAMKLRKEEMGLFGLCPAWDDFFLVVCEICGRLVKPQALKGHLELRHATSLDRAWDHSELSVPHSTTSSGKSNGGGSSGGSSGGRHASSSPSVQQPTSQQHHLPPQQSISGGKSASAFTSISVNSITSGSNEGTLGNRPQVTKGSPTPLSNHNRHPVPKIVSKASAPSPVDSKQSIPHRTPLSTHSPTASPKNRNIDPIVRVERMSSNAVMKKVASALTSAGKELPSPQQPPPSVSMGTAAGVLGSTSGPGPGTTAGSTVVVVVSSGGGSVGQSNAVDVPLSVKTGDPDVSVPANQKSPVMGGSSKSRKGSKEKKVLLCKDREYDPNKHCGVIVAENSKPCTRSLTCKTHSLSLRRAVCGRKKHFDELLSDHRATKEALVRASQQARSGDGHGQTSQHALSLGDTANSKSSTGFGRLNHSGNAVSCLSKSSSKSGKHNNLPIHRLSASKASQQQQQDGHQGSSSHQQRLEGPSPLSTTPKNVSSSSSSSSTPDPPYITHHPKPAAMCTFGVSLLGSGRQLLSRHWEQPRAALKFALFSTSSSSSSSSSSTTTTTNSQQQHPPLKKLCLDSRLPPVSHSLDPSDPYRFPCAEPNNNIISSSHQSSGKQASTILASGASSNSTISANKLTSSTSSVTRPVVPNISNPQLSRSLSVQQPQALLAKAAGTGNPLPTTKTKPVKSNPKSDTNKLKNSSANRHSSSTTTNHSAAKKRRTSSNSSCNVVVVSTAGGNVTVSTTQTVSIAAAPHPTTTTLPLSFPLTIGEHLGALSRLQMSSPLVVSRNNLTIAPNIVRSQPMVTTASSKDNTVVMDVLNGQLPVLHSVTVSRTTPASTPTLLAAGPGGLGITLGPAGLMGQLTQQLQKQQQQKLATNPMVQMNSGNKVSNTKWSNSSGGSGGDSAKTKYRSRKSKAGSNVSLNHHHQQPLSSPIGLLIEGQPIGGGLLAATIAGGAGGTSNSHISSSPASSPSPILRTDGLSPLLANGLSSPTLCGGKVLNSGGTGGSLLGQHSPASGSSTPSPGTAVEVTSAGTTAASAPGQGVKLKSRQTPSYAKSVTAAVGHGNLTFPVTLPTTARPSAPASTQSITYQQVFASQMLTPAQISQLNKKNSAPTALTLTSAALPLKLLAPQQQHLFVKSDEPPRRTEDPHSLPT